VNLDGYDLSSGVVFSRDVAPIIADACLGCHGADNPRANLRLDTFAGWKRGGRSGPLLVVGNAANSLLLRALRATDPRSACPRGDAPTKNSRPSPTDQRRAKYDGRTGTFARGGSPTLPSIRRL
jgi:hypothetical protein